MADDTPKTTKDEPPLCFVVGPIGDEGSETRRRADWLLRGIIKPAVKAFSADYRVIRADEMYEPGMIDSQVINAILDAEIVVADLSEGNPNAFYEIGLRHMAERPIIHMIDDRTPIPFDVKPFRTVVFSIENFEDVEAAKSALRRYLQEASKQDHEIDNPVTRARGRKNVQSSTLPEHQVIWQEIERLSRLIDEKPTPIAGSDGEIMDANEITSPTIDSVYFGRDQINYQKVQMLLRRISKPRQEKINSFFLEYPTGKISIIRMPDRSIIVKAYKKEYSNYFNI